MTPQLNLNPNPNDILRSRSVYLATPAYGGWLGVGYVNALMGLMNLMHNIGVRYTVSFKYNESLITRARNAMVDDYLKKSDFTDFFFIDADIGFDPRAVLALLLHNEDIIGVPCPRKSFCWSRVFKVLKQNNREYTAEELEKLAGEFVLNFPPDGAPTSLNLGQLTEVQDVGTGLMRIRREVFEKFKGAHPNRYFMPMMGEEGATGDPSYMFFQSRIDEDSGKFTPNGIPHYIPEDYAFCRDARKAGMKVWLAPWIATTHMGTYMYQGDMVAVAQAGGSLR